MTPKKPRQLKPRKCKTCGNTFEPRNSLQRVCSPRCALDLANKERAKREAKELREGRQRMMKRSDHLKEAQREFNLFIRTRDYDKPCISCGRYDVEMTTGGAWDCGHYLSVGSHPELRFNEDNAHKQCKSCNGGSGRFARKNHTVSQSYKANLIERIGAARVEALEGPQQPKHYTIDDLKALKATYKAKTKALKSENERKAA